MLQKREGQHSSRMHPKRSNFGDDAQVNYSEIRVAIPKQKSFDQQNLKRIRAEPCPEDFHDMTDFQSSRQISNGS